MKVKIAISSTLLALAGALVFARGDYSSNPYDALDAAPEQARIRPNPLENDPDAVPAGRKLYDRHCATCHGAGGEGAKKGPSLRVDAVQSVSAGTLFWTITNGDVREGMPVWSKLPEPQRWQIVSYLKSLGKAEVSDSPVPPGPVRGH